MVEKEIIRRVLQEHVDAENARDQERVLATYVEEGAEFVDVPSGHTFRDGMRSSGTIATCGTGSRDSCDESTAGPSVTMARS
jgi:hypothetical protein